MESSLVGWVLIIASQAMFVIKSSFFLIFKIYEMAIM